MNQNRIKKFVACAWLSMTFLAGAAFGQEAAYLQLERSTDGMETWEPLPIHEQVFQDDGTINMGLVAGSVFYRMRITTELVSLGETLIPGGTFQMGDSKGDNLESPLVFFGEVPVHTVTLPSFYIQRTEVTKAEWDVVMIWAKANGYEGIVASGKGRNHPVYDVSWGECIAFANAKSQMEGLQPCYRDSTNRVIKSSDIFPVVNFAANGYRLPTEAEWEYAARGGLSGQRFPGGDTIDHDKANYAAGSLLSYDATPYTAYTNHPDWDDQPVPFTNPVATFAPNGYGLYGMAGNVSEWCWDWYSPNYYSSSPGTDPKGPDVHDGFMKTVRGGTWEESATYCRVSCRESSPAFNGGDTIGFRLVRRETAP